MIVLGIETSCDETSAAVYSDFSGVLSSAVYSQTDIHKNFGGVVPEVASRNHAIKITPIVENVLKDAGIKPDDIDLIGVTASPGLIGALFVGVSFAKGLSYAIRKPLIPVNHLMAHILTGEIENEELRPPYCGMVISGGHTHIYMVDKSYHFELISKTLDDAAGEAFDKVAKIIGFEYPGGPEIEKCALKGDETAIKFPIPLQKNINFSFSGLKTAVIRCFESGRHDIEDICASFQKAVAESLIHKILLCHNKFNFDKIAVSGGVACNGYIREQLKKRLSHKIKVYFPSKYLCSDNGIMVAHAAVKLYSKRVFMGFKGLAKDRDESAINF